MFLDLPQGIINGRHGGSNGNSDGSPNGYNRWSSRAKTNRFIKVIYINPGRCAVKEMDPPGYLVCVSSLVPYVILVPPKKPDDNSNKGGPEVPNDMGSPCSATGRQFSNKQDLSVAMMTQPSKEWTLMLPTDAGIPYSREPMVPPTQNPMVPLTDLVRTSQLSMSKRLKQQARHHADERNTKQMNVPSHNPHLPATDLCHERTLDEAFRYTNAPMNECPSNWMRDQVNQRKNQLSKLAQCTEHLNCTNHQDAQPAFTRGLDHGSTAPKTTADVTNAQLHCGMNYHAPDFPLTSSTSPDMTAAPASAPLPSGMKCSTVMLHLVSAHAALANPPSHPGENCSAVGLCLVYIDLVHPKPDNEIQNRKEAVSKRTMSKGPHAHNEQANKKPTNE